MAQVRSWAGLDVHVRSVLAVTVDGVSGEMRSRAPAGRDERGRRVLRRAAGPDEGRLRGRADRLRPRARCTLRGSAASWRRQARSSAQRQDRVKTDQRDAGRVLRLLMIDGLHAVRGPQLRGGGAARPRAGARGAARRSDARAPAPQQAAAAPRHRPHYTASAWTARHRAWLTRIDLGGGAQLTLLDYLHAIDAMVIRRDALQTAIGEEADRK